MNTSSETTSIDFAKFRRCAESDPLKFMEVLQPGGTYDPHQMEYYAASPSGGAGRSCKTSLRPGKMFVGCDFADNSSNWSSPIDIACASFDAPKSKPYEAVKMAAECLGYVFSKVSINTSSSSHSGKYLSPLPVPDGSHPDFKLGHREPSLVSTYTKPEGSLFCLIARYEAQQDNERKLILPWAYGCLNGVTGWHRKMPPGQRPLLGLGEYMSQAESRPVLIVEGEKTVAAAKRLTAGHFFVTTWIGGSQAADKTDFHILDGASIYIWPDANESGAKAALKIAHTLSIYPQSKVFIVKVPEGKEAGWDLADAEEAGWTQEMVLCHINDQAVPYKIEVQATEATKVTETVPAIVSETVIVFSNPVHFDDQSPTPMPTNVVPGILGQYSAAVADSIQAPFELALINALGATAAAVQRKYRVAVHDGYSEPLNIFALAAMPPGERKSAVVKACRFPLLEWEAEQGKLIEPELNQALIERQINEEAQKILMASAKKCQTPEDRHELARQLMKLKDEMKEPPVAPRLLADDTTPEALAVLMSRHHQRIAMLEAEGGFFDILSGRYSGGMPNLDAVLKAWSGESVRIDRRHAEPITLAEPTLTLILSAQPEVLTGLAQTSTFRGRGLIGRLLFLLPKSLVGSRMVETCPVPNGVLESYRATLRRLLDVPLSDDYQPQLLRLDSSAHKLWLDFSQDIEHKMAEGGELHSMRDWGGKLPGQTLRLAGLIHVTLHPNPGNETIASQLMESAINLSGHLIEHAKAAYSLLGADETIECARTILKWLTQERLESFSARACLQKVKGRWPKMGEVNQGLSVLEDRGYILQEFIDSPKRGRPSRQYLVNPVLQEREP